MKIKNLFLFKKNEFIKEKEKIFNQKQIIMFQNIRVLILLYYFSISRI